MDQGPGSHRGLQITQTQNGSKLRANISGSKAGWGERKVFVKLDLSITVDSQVSLCPTLGLPCFLVCGGKVQAPSICSGSHV
jgi:hypothetical protein